MTTKLFLTLAALGLAASIGRAQTGGGFDLKWSTIDGGGASSRGGQFTVTGTIGQPDAGFLAGGQFKLEGGFWNGLTLVQLPGAPLLKIKYLGNGFALLSWPISVNGFALEENPNIAQPNTWSSALQSVVDTASEHTVTVPALGIVKCYRLKYQ